MGDTTDFSTEHASGSTSQAANIMEAVDFGAKLLLIDEDRSATNFMIRDSIMKELIKKEPITPFTDRVNELYKQKLTLDGELIDEQLLVQNSAIMMYSPYLNEPGEQKRYDGSQYNMWDDN